MALLVSEDGQLSLEQICSIVEEQKENAVRRVQRPKGGEVFLIDTDGGKNSKYLCRYLSFSPHTLYRPI